MSGGRESAERAELANAYPGPAWKARVRNMSDAQVHAVSVSIRNRKEKERAEAERHRPWLTKQG